MASSRGVDLAVDVLSTLGAVFWSVQLAPQIYLNWKRKSGAGLQPSMMLAWAVAGLPLAVHNILAAQPIALQIQPQILTSLSLLTWAQVMYYDKRWSMARCCYVLGSLCVAFAGVQAAFVLGFNSKSVSRAAKQRCILATAVLAGVGLCIGVLRQHFDVYRHRTVRGIAWSFVFLDAAGDLASLLSVVIRPPADRLAAAIYASELSLWTLMMVAGLAFNLRHFLSSHRSQTQNGSPERPVDAGLDEEVMPDASSSTSSAFSRVHPASWRQVRTVLRRVGTRH